MSGFIYRPEIHDHVDHVEPVAEFHPGVSWQAEPKPSAAASYSDSILEQAVIASICQPMQGAFQMAINAGIQPEHFTDTRLGKLVSRMAEMPEPDYLEAILKMQSDGEIDDIGMQYVLEICEQEAGTLAIGSHCRELAARHARRGALALQAKAELYLRDNRRAEAIEFLSQAEELERSGAKSADPLRIEQFIDLQPEEFELPEIIIEGMAYAGAKVLFSGASKSRKTWALIHLCLALQSGALWWGMRTAAVPTLLIDLELQKSLLLKRIRWVAEAAGISITENLLIKSLRGQKVSFAAMRKDLISTCRARGIKAIAIDPVYRIKTGEENSNDDIADFLLMVEEVAHEAGAIVALTHHYAKGNSAAKSSVDRMSGAGVWARDPDVLMSMTEAEDSTQLEPLFVIEPTLRDFPPVEPFAVRWDAPLWIRDNDARTTLKGAGGRPPKDEDFLHKIPVGESNAMRFDQLGVDLSKQTFEKKIRDRKDVFKAQKRNSSGRMENHYYRLDPSSIGTSIETQESFDVGDSQTA